MEIREQSVRDLPPSPEVVTVPRYFSPSQWTRVEACALSVWARADALAVPIEAGVGRVFHRARELILGRPRGSAQQSGLADAALDAALGEAYSSAFPSTPAVREWLQGELGRCKWIDLVGDLRRWNATVQGIGTSPHTRTMGHVPSGQLSNAVNEFPDEISFGLERTWTSNELRLRGRPDESRCGPDDVVEVCDYKSSTSVFSAGRGLEAAETQVRLYLLMAELLTGHVAVGSLVGQTVIQVAWTAEIRNELRLRVEAVGATYVAGVTTSPEALAHPGAHCVRCRNRPRCKNYLSEAPAWWRELGVSHRPLDVWGRIERLETHDSGTNVWLRDAVGRLVVIRNLSPAWQIATLPYGTTLFFFDLEATEDLMVHGRRIHPQAFHESSPGPGRRRARYLHVFKSGEA